MSQNLWKTTESKSFGNSDFIEWCMNLGVGVESQPALALSVGLLRFALKDCPHLTTQTREFIEAELANFAPDEDEDTIVDVYGVC